MNVFILLVFAHRLVAIEFMTLDDCKQAGLHEGGNWECVISTSSATYNSMEVSNGRSAFSSSCFNFG